MEITAPSGKWSGDENFPVGSRLIARRLRAPVMRYYAFARHADDIADAPDLAPDEKVRRLDALDAALSPGAQGPEVATALRDVMARHGVDASCGRDLLVAFRQDARQARYADWDALMDYCRFSAHPVGRFLMQLHGEAGALAPAGDALCAALQVLNHLQDIAEDRRRLERVYLPQDWMAEAGATEADLDAPRASPALRQVMDRCLDGCDVLLDRAEPLAASMRSRRLGAETAVIQRLARRLAGRLGREDPLAGRVRCSRLDVAAAFAAGVGRLARGGASG